MTITPYKGFGVAPFGTSPFGYGNPALADPNVGKVFKKTDSSVGNNRFIDPSTRDYSIDVDTGRIVGQDAMQQMVYLALVTVRGSSAVTDLGQGFTSIKQINQNVEAQITNEVNTALQILTRNKQIFLNDVFVQIDANKVARIHVVWTDTSKNVQITTII